jgi:hypothetical protein
MFDGGLTACLVVKTSRHAMIPAVGRDVSSRELMRGYSMVTVAYALLAVGSMGDMVSTAPILDGVGRE